jgi:uncharacterized protein YidB (DUF937 family)
MGMLDGLLGGIVGAGMVSVVNGIIEKHGGLQGVVSEFEKNGLGPTQVLPQAVDDLTPNGAIPKG